MKRLATVLLMLILTGSVFADDTQTVLRVLALDRPQALVEQRLADSLFTPTNGIKVVIEACASSNLEQRLAALATTKDSSCDLITYEGQWLGPLATAGLLERLDTGSYLGTNAFSVAADLTEPEMLDAATNSALAFSILRPEMTYRLAKYPTVERDLYQRKFAKHDTAPVFGLPWSCPAELLVYRTDLVDGAFARVLPQVAEFYNTEVAPNWTNSWRMFASAARLVQLVHLDVRPVVARGAPSAGAVLEDFLPIFWSFGGELWSEERRKADGVLNNTTAVKALQYYCDWNAKSKILPPECVQWGNADALKAISDGKVAMGITWPHLAQRLQDDRQSRAAGRISVATLPGDVAISVQAKPSKDPGGAVTGAIDAFQAETSIRRCTLSGGAGIGISVFSKQKPAAWQYLEWLLSRETQTKLIFEPGLNYFSPRKDLKAESRSASPVNRVVMEAFNGGGVRSSWNIPGAAQLDAILARECSLALRGTKTPREALDTAAKEIQFILDRGVSK